MSIKDYLGKEIYKNAILLIPNEKRTLYINMANYQAGTYVICVMKRE